MALSRYLFLLALIPFTASLSAEIAVGGATASVQVNGDVDFSVPVPGPEEFRLFRVELNDGNSSGNNVRLEETYALEDVDDVEEIGLRVSVSILLENNHTIVASSAQNLRVTGDGAVAIEVQAVDWNEDPITTAHIFLSGATSLNENIRGFTITDRRTPCRLTGVSEGTGTAPTVYLERHTTGGVWEEVRRGNAPAFDHYAFLEPGTYRVRAIASFFVNENNVPVSASYSYDLQVGDLVLGEYSDPALGTMRTDSPALNWVAAAIVSEVDRGDGTTEVEITVDLENTANRPWSELEVNLVEDFAGSPAVAPSFAPLTYPPLEVGATVSPQTGDLLTVLVPTAELEAFRATILDGSRFTVTGRELWLFYFPVRVVVEGDGLDVSGEDGLSTNSATHIAPGTVVLEEEAVYAIPPDIVTVGSLLTVTQGADRLLPFLVSGTEVVSVPLQPDLYVLEGQQIFLTDILKEGAMSTTVTLAHPTGLDVTEGAEGEIVPLVWPMHFNRVQIADAIELSGSFFLKPGPIGVEIEAVAGALKRFAVVATFHAEANLLIETKGQVDNRAAPLLEQEADLLTLSLFTVVLPAGFTITPELSLGTGAVVDAPQGLSLPVTTSLDVTFTAGMDDGVPYYDADFSSVSPRLSPPAIYAQLEASVEAWLAAQLKVGVGMGSGLAEIGPTFGTRLVGTLGVAPFDDPWWTLEGAAELRAGLELSLLTLFDVADAEQVLSSHPLFALEADAGLVELAAVAELPDNPGIRPLSGDTTRWVRVLQPENVSADSPVGAFVLPLAGSDDFIAGCGELFGGEMSRYGPDGSLHWVLDTGPAPVIGAVAEPTGHFTTLSTGFSRIHLGRFDGEGTRLWAKTHVVPFGNDTQQIARGENSSGEAEYFVLSRTDDGVRKPSVAKFDQDGNLLWAKLYTPDPAGNEGVACELGDCLVTAEGDLVFVAVTDTDINSGGGPLNTVNSSDNGLAVKVDGETGAVLWATLIAHERIPQYHALAEGPDGSLYLAGNHAASVLDDLPSMLVTKLNRHGVLLDSVLIGHGNGRFPNDADAAFFAQLPHNGGTPYDHIRDIEWIDGALWVGGEMGIYNGSLGYTNGTSAFTARISELLSVDRFVLHAGPHYDQIGAIADGGDGLLAVGTTRSFFPWPAGAADQATNTPDARLVMKLPWEGALRFHALSSGDQPTRDTLEPDRGSFFVNPVTFPASIFPTFAHPDPVIYAEPVPILVDDLALTVGTPLAAPSAMTPVAHHALEAVPASLIDSYEDFVGWNQLSDDPEADDDGDGLAGPAEFYYGLDPFAADAPIFDLLFDDNGHATLTLQRSAAAAEAGWPLPIEVSLDLDQWDPLTGVGVSSEPLDALRDLLHLTPTPLVGENRSFYRLTVPGPAE